MPFVSRAILRAHLDVVVKANMEARANDQKVFYHLLQKYRERQLEDFDPDIAHAQSDYHHLKPSTWRKKKVTREFTNDDGDGINKSVSRITIVSSVADIDEDSIDTYDPFNAQHTPIERRVSQISRARVTVHRSQTSTPKEKDSRYLSFISSPRCPSTRSSSPDSFQESLLGNLPIFDDVNDSFATSSSPQKSPYMRKVGIRRKRGVDFSQLRARHSRKKRDSDSQSSRRRSLYTDNPGTPRPDSDVLPAGDGPTLRVAKRRSAGVAAAREAITDEEVRKVSLGLAQDCDEAFGSSLVLETPHDGGDGKGCDASAPVPRTPGSASIPVDTDSSGTDEPRWSYRPLPDLPSVFEDSIASPNSQSTRGKSNVVPGRAEESGGQAKTVIPRTRRSMPTLSNSRNLRISSDPQVRRSRLQSANEKRYSSAIQLTHYADDVAEPGATPSNTSEGKGLDYLSRVERTIRVVIPTPKTNPFRRDSKHSSGLQMDRSVDRRLNTPASLTSPDLYSHDSQNWTTGGLSKSSYSAHFSKELFGDSELDGWLENFHKNHPYYRNSSSARRSEPVTYDPRGGPGALRDKSLRRDVSSEDFQPLASRGMKKKRFDLRFWKQFKPKNEPKVTVGGNVANKKINATPGASWLHSIVTNETCGVFRVRLR